MISLKTIAALPAGVECNIDYHLLAHKALWHLLERITACEKLSQPDRHVSEFLSFYLRAWSADMPKDDLGRVALSINGVPTGTLASALRGGLALLKAIQDDEEMSDGYVGLADTLFQFVHQWKRELQTLVQEQPNTSLEPEIAKRG